MKTLYTLANIRLSTLLIKSNIHIKSLSLIGLLSALFGMNYAWAGDLSVSGSQITLTMDRLYSISSQLEEDELVHDASSDLVIDIADRLVVREQFRKISFTPLYTENVESFDSSSAARSLLSVKLPRAHLSVMTLYQSFGGAVHGEKNICEFLVLDTLLNSEQRQLLNQKLENADLSVTARTGFLSFDCSNKGAKDV